MKCKEGDECYTPHPGRLSIYGRCLRICIPVDTKITSWGILGNKARPRSLCQMLRWTVGWELVYGSRGNRRDRIHSFSDLAVQTLLSTEVLKPSSRSHRPNLVRAVTRIQCAVALLDGCWGLGASHSPRSSHTPHLDVLPAWEAENKGLNSYARPPRVALRNELGKLSRNRDTTVRHPSNRHSDLHSDLQVSISSG